MDDGADILRRFEQIVESVLNEYGTKTAPKGETWFFSLVAHLVRAAGPGRQVEKLAARMRTEDSERRKRREKRISSLQLLINDYSGDDSFPIKFIFDDDDNYDVNSELVPLWIQDPQSSSRAEKFARLVRGLKRLLELEEIAHAYTAPKRRDRGRPPTQKAKNAVEMYWVLRSAGVVESDEGGAWKASRIIADMFIEAGIEKKPRDDLYDSLYDKLKRLLR